MAVAAVAVVAMLGTVVIAWERRTAPPWPVAAGTPYEISLGGDGCPVTEEGHAFVDAPGDLVPPGATEITLCMIPEQWYTPPPGAAEPPRRRVLRASAADFAGWLNQLPDRNTTWRQMQRDISGWWPDAPPDGPLGEACPLIGHSHHESFVLRYADRPPVLLVLTCGFGFLSSGARTRAADGAVDEFVRRFGKQ